MILLFLCCCRWVLTAGHCLQNEKLSVHFGMSENGTFTESMEVPTTNQFQHPQYPSRSPQDPHDIGLLIKIIVSSHDYTHFQCYPNSFSLTITERLDRAAEESRG